jgi:MOSC domain-containing protein YiiM
MRLLSVQVSMPRDITDGEGTWQTAFFKEPVDGPVQVRRLGLDGDGNADPENHGGVDKAALIYSADHFPSWRQEHGLAGLTGGGFGENLTIEGDSEAGVCIGDVYRVGGALLEVAQPRTPCWKLARRWGLDWLPRRVLETGRSGWYVRVLEEGPVQAGDAMELVERPATGLTVLLAGRQLYGAREDWDLNAAAALAACPALARPARERLALRVQRILAQPPG